MKALTKARMEAAREYIAMLWRIAAKPKKYVPIGRRAKWPLVDNMPTVWEADFFINKLGSMPVFLRVIFNAGDNFSQPFVQLIEDGDTKYIARFKNENYLP